MFLCYRLSKATIRIPFGMISPSATVFGLRSVLSCNKASICALSKLIVQWYYYVLILKLKIPQRVTVFCIYYPTMIIYKLSIWSWYNNVKYFGILLNMSGRHKYLDLQSKWSEIWITLMSVSPHPLQLYIFKKMRRGGVWEGHTKDGIWMIFNIISNCSLKKTVRELLIVFSLQLFWGVICFYWKIWKPSSWYLHPIIIRQT